MPAALAGSRMLVSRAPIGSLLHGASDFALVGEESLYANNTGKSASRLLSCSGSSSGCTDTSVPIIEDTDDARWRCEAEGQLVLDQIEELFDDVAMADSVEEELTRLRQQLAQTHESLECEQIRDARPGAASPDGSSSPIGEEMLYGGSSDVTTWPVVEAAHEACKFVGIIATRADGAGSSAGPAGEEVLFFGAADALTVAQPLLEPAQPLLEPAASLESSDSNMPLSSDALTAAQPLPEPVTSLAWSDSNLPLSGPDWLQLQREGLGREWLKVHDMLHRGVGAAAPVLSHSWHLTLSATRAAVRDSSDAVGLGLEATNDAVMRGTEASASAVSSCLGAVMHGASMTAEAIESAGPAIAQSTAAAPSLWKVASSDLEASPGRPKGDLEEEITPEPLSRATMRARFFPGQMPEHLAANGGSVGGHADADASPPTAVARQLSFEARAGGSPPPISKRLTLSQLLAEEAAEAKAAAARADAAVAARIAAAEAREELEAAAAAAAAMRAVLEASERDELPAPGARRWVAVPWTHRVQDRWSSRGYVPPKTALASVDDKLVAILQKQGARTAGAVGARMAGAVGTAAPAPVDPADAEYSEDAEVPSNRGMASTVVASAQVPSDHDRTVLRELADVAMGAPTTVKIEHATSIGIALVSDAHGRIVIHDVQSGSIAAREGVTAPCFLTAINGCAVAGMAVVDVQSRLRNLMRDQIPVLLAVAAPIKAGNAAAPPDMAVELDPLEEEEEASSAAPAAPAQLAVDAEEEEVVGASPAGLRAGARWLAGEMQSHAFAELASEGSGSPPLLWSSGVGEAEVARRQSPETPQEPTSTGASTQPEVGADVPPALARIRSERASAAASPVPPASEHTLHVPSTTRGEGEQTTLLADASSERRRWWWRRLRTKQAIRQAMPAADAKSRPRRARAWAALQAPLRAFGNSRHRYRSHADVSAEHELRT